MPEICSRSTPLIASMRFCILRKYGTMREMISPTTTPSTGTTTRSSAESSTSSWSAMMTPPTSMMGAMTMMVKPMSTTIWTCWTSFVVRVMSDGAPSTPISCAENDWTRVKSPLRTSRPNDMATLAPKYTATIAQITCPRLIASMTPPVRMM
ncbi:hypothetical protein D3C74_341130 [compost metagenome]